MQQKMLAIYSLILKLVVCALALSVSACATLEQEEAMRLGYPKLPIEKVFQMPYDEVWMSILKAVSVYEQGFSDQVSGQYVTKEIKADKAWVSPRHKPIPPGGFSSNIQLTTIKGKNTKTQKENVLVKVQKNITVKTSFFNQTKEIKSDGLEESALLYRIERGLEITRLIKEHKLKTEREERLRKARDQII